MAAYRKARRTDVHPWRYHAKVCAGLTLWNILVPELSNTGSFILIDHIRDYGIRTESNPSVLRSSAAFLGVLMLSNVKR